MTSRELGRKEAKRRFQKPWDDHFDTEDRLDTALAIAGVLVYLLALIGFVAIVWWLFWR